MKVGDLVRIDVRCDFGVPFRDQMGIVIELLQEKIMGAEAVRVLFPDHVDILPVGAIQEVMGD